MYYTKSRPMPAPRKFILLTVGFLILLLAGYWQQIASAAVGEGTIPPETVPPLPTESNQALITVIHASPFDVNIDNTALDVCTEAGSVIPEFAGLKYLENASIVVDPGTIDLKVADAGTNCQNVRIDIDPFTLVSQQKVVLVITGDGVNQQIDVLLLVTDAGVQRVYLPVVSNNAGTVR